MTSKCILPVFVWPEFLFVLRNLRELELGKLRNSTVSGELNKMQYH